MNDLVLLGIVLGSTTVIFGVIIAGLITYLHFSQKRDLSERLHELKIFQMENTRIIQEWRKDTTAFLKTMGLRIAQIYEILGKTEEEH